MKKSIFVSFSLALLALTACKKNNPAPTAVTARVATVYDDSSHLSTLYYYSPSGLLSGDFDDSGHYSYGYHYFAGGDLADVSMNQGATYYSVLYFWNDKSSVDSSAILNTSTSATIEKKYTYDNNNFLTNVKWYNYQNVLVLIENYTITNGNITGHSYAVLDSSNHALPNGASSYTYNTALNNTTGNDYFGQGYLGSSSKNIASSCTYTNASGSGTVNYSYHYSGSYISSVLVYADSAGVNGARIDSTHYSYYNQ